MFSGLYKCRNSHPSNMSDAWYQAFYTPKKKGKLKSHGAQNLVPIATKRR